MRKSFLPSTQRTTPGGPEGPLDGSLLNHYIIRVGTKLHTTDISVSPSTLSSIVVSTGGGSDGACTGKPYDVLQAIIVMHARATMTQLVVPFLDLSFSSSQLLFVAEGMPLSMLEACGMHYLFYE